MLAARLQAIQAILELFYADKYYENFDEDLSPLKEQLEEEFDMALNELLRLIDED